jgi:hypothetical protein
VADVSSSDVLPKSMRGREEGSRKRSSAARPAASTGDVELCVGMAADVPVDRSAAAIVDIVKRCFMV